MCVELEAMKNELKKNGAARAVAESREAQELLRRVDASAWEAAAKAGDAGSLKKLLTQALATPEGKALAEKIKKAVSKNG